ncbi:hypothetical protein F4703DRAFT_1487521 [Phycomyces blakesleeanus]
MIVGCTWILLYNLHMSLGSGYPQTFLGFFFAFAIIIIIIIIKKNKQYNIIASPAVAFISTFIPYLDF